MIKKIITDIYKAQLERNHYKFGESLDPEEFLLWLETEPIYSTIEKEQLGFIQKFDQIFDTFTQEKKERAFDLLIKSAIREMDITELEYEQQSFHESLIKEVY